MALLPFLLKRVPELVLVEDRWIPGLERRLAEVEGAEMVDDRRQDERDSLR